MKPTTLDDVARQSLAGDSFGRLLRNFLDEFYASPAAEMIEAEPPSLAESQGNEGAVRDAYLAAVAESLADAAKVPVPRWCCAESRKLRRPWFAVDAASMRAVLLWESPPAFRSRNLFVSENALSRA